jgi:hypothetical protein
MNKHFIIIPLSFGNSVAIPIEDIRQINQNAIGEIYINTDNDKFCLNNDAETLEHLIERINKILKL